MSESEDKKDKILSQAVHAETALLDEGKLIEADGKVALSLDAEQKKPDPTSMMPSHQPQLQCAKLIVLAGQEMGREISLPKRKIILGRGGDSEIKLLDIAISRQHAQIEYSGDRFLFSDLGSGNGSKVNGQKVEHLELSSGDVIEIGNLVLRFLEIASSANAQSESSIHASFQPYTPKEELANQKPEQNQKKNRWFSRPAFLLSTGISLVLLVPAFIYFFMPDKETIQNQTYQILAKALYSAQNENFEIARKYFEQAKSIESLQTLALVYEGYAKNNEKNKVLLDQARQEFQEKKFASADNIITQIDHSSYAYPKTLEIASEMRFVEQQLSFEFVHDMVAKRDFSDQTRSQLEAVISDPKRLSPELVQLLSTIDFDGKTDDKVKELQKQRNQLDPHLVEGQIMLQSGDIRGAISHFSILSEQSGMHIAKQFLQASKMLQVSLIKGKDLHQQKRPKEGIKQLLQAYNSYHSVTSQDGKLLGEINTLIADCYYLLGIDYYHQNESEEAKQNFRTALKYDPTHKLAREQLKISLP